MINSLFLDLFFELDGDDMIVCDQGWSALGLGPKSHLVLSHIVDYLQRLRNGDAFYSPATDRLRHEIQ